MTQRAGRQFSAAVAVGYAPSQQGAAGTRAPHHQRAYSGGIISAVPAHSVGWPGQGRGGTLPGCSPQSGSEGQGTSLKSCFLQILKKI